MSRLRYYSSSPFFKWLRKKVGIKKPVALAWGEWDDWEEQTKKDHPVGWFLTETLPKLLEKPEDFIKSPFEAIDTYIYNRFVSKTHYLPTHLKPGKWYETDYRLIHGMFGALVDFVEIETASQTLAWIEDKEELKKYGVPKSYGKWWGRYRSHRCAKAGIEHLEWAASLTFNEGEGLDDNDPRIGQPTPQAIAARETLNLYHWWTQVRPNRGDAWDISGFRAHWDAMEAKHGGAIGRWLFGGKMSDEDRAEYDRFHKILDQLEEDWEREDEQQMIRLIKLRRSLWT